MEEIKMPQLGQSVEEASIVEWFKKEGDRVEKGEPLFSIQTDKAEIEYESPVAGTLRKILLPPDELAPVLTVAALVGGEDEELPDLSQYGAGAGVQSAAAAEPEAAEQPTPAVTTAQTPAAPAPAPAGEQAGVSPRARNTAARLGVDPASITGSGPKGRIIEVDVVAAAERQPKVTPTARRLAELEGVNLAAIAGTGPAGKILKADVERAAAAPATQPAQAAGAAGRTPLSPMRRIIAERMSQSKHDAPHYYMTVEVDMTASRQFRQGVGAFKPSYNDFVLRACVRAIQDYPLVNARWAGDAIEQVADINIGFAVALPDGLVVPVVKQAQSKTLQEIHNETRQLTEKARNGKLTPDDYSGNTFTVSNLGAFGVDHFTAIINQPDSAILAVGQMREKPVVIDGGIHVRPIMKMTLSSDHRVIDGAVAAQFLGRVKEILENADY